MVNKSNDLRAVSKAVTQNGSSILMTALFGCVVVCITAGRIRTLENITFLAASACLQPVPPQPAPRRQYPSRQYPSSQNLTTQSCTTIIAYVSGYRREPNICAAEPPPALL